MQTAKILKKTKQTNMVHTEFHEKKKDKKRGEEEIFPKGNFHFKCFLPEERDKKK